MGINDGDEQARLNESQRSCMLKVLTYLIPSGHRPCFIIAFPLFFLFAIFLLWSLYPSSGEEEADPEGPSRNRVGRGRQKRANC